MIVVRGSVVAKPGRLDELLALSREHVHRSRREPGCLEHGVSLDPEHDRRLVFYERWLDRAALDRHFSNARSRRFAAAASELAAEPPEIEIFTTTEREQTVDVKQAMLDPASAFANPADVVSTEHLSTAQKIKILRRWEYDARELEVAEEENMGGGPPDLLEQVLAALHSLDAEADLEHSPPTKQGGA